MCSGQGYEPLRTEGRPAGLMVAPQCLPDECARSDADVWGRSATHPWGRCYQGQTLRRTYNPYAYTARG